jgi:predicted secreted protein
MSAVSAPAILLALLGSLASLPAKAEQVRYNQVSLHAEVSAEVAHDRMRVTLYSEARDSDPARLAADITGSINASLAQARKARGVLASLGSRNSYPVYDEDGQRLTGWRERAELRLESSDFAALAALTGELLQDLKMGGMDFGISDPLRRKNEDALLKEAIAAFRARAQLASEALGGSSYKIVSLSLSSNGSQPPRPMYAMAMKGAMREAAPTPEIEAGSSQVSFGADGVIEVQLP